MISGRLPVAVSRKPLYRFSTETPRQLVDNQPPNIQRRRRCRRRSVEHVHDEIVFDNHEVIDQLAIATKSLRPHA